MNALKSENEKLIIAATNYARKKLNIDPSLWVFVNGEEMFKSANHSGLYDKEHFLIRYNLSWLKDAKEDRILKCAFHEVFHVVQHSAVIEFEQGISSEFFSDEELKQLSLEFKDENYNDDSDAWANQLVEVQAESFAEYLYGIFLKEKMTAKKLILDYQDMFPNKE